MVNVRINEEDLKDLLHNRVCYWTDNEEIIALYDKMYESYVDGGCFEGAELDINAIVDNDYINYCQVIEEDEEEFKELVKIYKSQGLGDCSCESTNNISFIEAVDNEEEPTMFLVRY